MEAIQENEEAIEDGMVRLDVVLYPQLPGALLQRQVKRGEGAGRACQTSEVDERMRCEGGARESMQHLESACGH